MLSRMSSLFARRPPFAPRIAHPRLLCDFYAAGAESCMAQAGHGGIQLGMARAPRVYVKEQ